MIASIRRIFTHLPPDLLCHSSGAQPTAAPQISGPVSGPSGYALGTFTA